MSNTLLVASFTARELAALRRNYFLLGALLGAALGAGGLGLFLESMGRIGP